MIHHWSCQWEKFPDFKHATTGECLWINSEKCPKWVRDKLKSLKTLSPGQSGRAQLQLLTALKECGESRDLIRGEKLHEQAKAAGLTSNRFLAGTLISMYAKCGRIQSAQEVFDTILHRDVVAWNVLILGYVQNGEFSEALKLFDTMDCEPDDRTLVYTLKACGNLACKDPDQRTRCLEKGLAMHARAAELGLISDKFVAGTLVDMYAKSGSLENARAVFEKIESPDAVTWGALILGHIENHEYEMALELFERMQATGGCEPDERLYALALKACTNLNLNSINNNNYLDKGREIHSQAVKKNCCSRFVESALMSMYSKAGRMLEARDVFDKMKSPDLVSWNTLLLGYVDNGEPEVALELFQRLQKASGVRPDSRTLVAGIVACSRCGAGEKEGQGKEKFLKAGDALHSLARSSNLLDIYVQSTLVDMYINCGSLVEARDVFDSMRHRNVVAWNTMIIGYVETGDSKSGWELFQEMTGSCEPNATTFIGAATACGNLMALKQAEQIHSRVKALGLDSESSLGTSLVSMYGKCGDMNSAQQAFEAIALKDTHAWNSLLSGYCMQGDTDEVINQFGIMMKTRKVEPNGITFLCILKACSRAGAVDEGQKLFAEMSTRYGVARSLEHYTCMVYLLGQANLILEAVETLQGMPFEADKPSWKAVLSGCRKLNNLEYGTMAFEELVKLDPRDAAAYVLMADIYRSLQMKNEAAKVERRRKAAGAWKKPAESWWTDDQGKIWHFIVNGGGVEECVVRKMKSLVKRMEDEEGYTGEEDVLQENGDVCEHSERLAVACALLKSGPSSEIRTMSSIRMCHGCHKFCGLISKMDRRRIICRDTSLVHDFKHGSCSCRGSW